jgi:DNA invertase Pin-like site-specific DNA recombinase
MTELTIGKVKREHLLRRAFLYIRQSTLRQVYENNESTKRQYALKGRLIAAGWDESMIEVIDSDLGQSGSDSEERHGFQYLMSEVSLGRAGIIAGIEVSRLSRSSSDWSKLLQIAALSDALIMDEDGIYNVNDFNDRLLLGLKGTLSEAELHYLRARMRGGLLNKAKRGELRRAIPVGYIYDENGQIRKDPDSQVQEAVMLLFNTFVRLGSANKLVREYERQGYLFPRRQHNKFKCDEFLWERMTQSLALRTLKNPMYAGIYTYGKTQVRHTVGGRKKIIVPKEEYHAWLPSSHPAYISETQFDENNKQLEKNTRPKFVDLHSGAVREGPALLQGIALCGKCGRKMSINYTCSKSKTHPFYICNENFRSYGEAICQNVRGENIDLVIESLLLETINPLTMDAAIAVQSEMSERKAEILRLYSQQMERAHYEMDLAKRRYLRVDPDNRLVAAELEHDWNQRVITFETAKTAYEQKCEMEIRAVDDEMKLSLMQLVSDFPSIWKDPQTSSREKKRIARHVLQDVTITSETSKIILGIRYKSGSTKVLEIPNIKRNLNLANMEAVAASEIKELLYSELILTYNEIAVILNEKGLRSGSNGKLFDAVSVSSLIQRSGLPKRTDIVMSNTEGWLTAKDKMAELGIGKSKLCRMRKSGELIFKRCCHHGAAYLYKPEDVSDSSLTKITGTEKTIPSNMAYVK